MCPQTAYCLLQTFRKVIGEGSIGRVHLGRWQETDVAIKVLGHVPTQSSLPVAAPMHSTGQMSAIDEGDSGEEVSDQDDDELLDSSMALTIKTLEREVSTCSLGSSHADCMLSTQSTVDAVNVYSLSEMGLLSVDHGLNLAWMHAMRVVIVLVPCEGLINATRQTLCAVHMLALHG